MAKEIAQSISGMANSKFKRRTYSTREFLTDMYYLTKKVRNVRWIMREQLIPNAFRERLMLAVISVYGCRYCCWVHTREALRNGIEQGEIATLLNGSVDICPEEEAVALLYAQHWADSNASPDTEAVRMLKQTYGAERAEAINLVLRMIRLGNLAGNTWDSFLYRISFGRLGE